MYLFNTELAYAHLKLFHKFITTINREGVHHDLIDRGDKTPKRSEKEQQNANAACVLGTINDKITFDEIFYM